MAIHRMVVSDPRWFSLLRDGKKTVEGRKNSPKWSGISVGDYLVITNASQTKSFVGEVTKINSYPTLDTFLEGESLDSLLPGITSVEEAKSIYNQLLSEEEIIKYGMIGIHLKRVVFYADSW